MTKRKLKLPKIPYKRKKLIKIKYCLLQTHLKLWKKKKKSTIQSVERAVRKKIKRLILDHLKLSNPVNYLSESRRLAVIESSNNLQDERAASKKEKSLVLRRRKTLLVSLKEIVSELVKIVNIEGSNRQMHLESRTLLSENK